jgi:hypothetical protein
VGANANGHDDGCPRIVVVVSISDTSRSTRGRNSTRRNASMLRAIDTSCDAPPST